MRAFSLAVSTPSNVSSAVRQTASRRAFRLLGPAAVPSAPQERQGKQPPTRPPPPRVLDPPYLSPNRCTIVECALRSLSDYSAGAPCCVVLKPPEGDPPRIRAPEHLSPLRNVRKAGWAPEAKDCLPGRDTEMAITNSHYVLKNPIKGPFPDELEVAVFGTGCFWCVSPPDTPSCCPSPLVLPASGIMSCPSPSLPLILRNLVTLHCLGLIRGTEKGFWRIPGVYSTAVGYASGHTPNADYR